MTLPSATITELDGSLGSIASPSDKMLAVVGPSSSGPLNTPSTFGRISDLVGAYGAGPMVEAAAHHIRRRGRVIVVRTATTTGGTASAVTLAGTGTSVGTVSAPTPNDDYEVAVRIVAGGTRGAAGITYQVSLDGGRTYGAVTALGTDTSITIPGAGGVTLALGAGSMVADDVYSFRTTAPLWSTSEVSAALVALQLATLAWDIVLVVGPIDAASFDAIDAAVVAMRTKGKYRTWIGSVRMPNAGESEATYRAALDAIFASKASKVGALCAGAVRHVSAVSGRQYRRPVAFVAASLEQGNAEHVNVAAIDLGPIESISIKDSNGNPDEHDELTHPGLDDARFYVLRTWEGVEGTYVNLPRIFSPSGSDFRIVPHRRVMNLACETLLPYLQRRLHKPVVVDETTGFIREEQALAIESAAQRLLESALLATPKASGVSFALNRTDNVLATRTISGQCRVIPLGYPEAITVEIGFTNPALQVQTA